MWFNTATNRYSSSLILFPSPFTTGTLMLSLNLTFVLTFLLVNVFMSYTYLSSCRRAEARKYNELGGAERALGGGTSAASGARGEGSEWSGVEC